MTRREKVSATHLVLSSILSHMFFMKMDLMNSSGLLCTVCHIERRRLRKLYNRLVTSWQVLTCLYLRSVPTEEVSTMSTQLQSNLSRVVNTTVRRYTSCEERSTRDCVLMGQADHVLGILETLMD